MLIANRPGRQKMADTQRGVHRLKKPGAPEDYVLVRDTGPGLSDDGMSEPAMEYAMPESMYKFKRIEPSVDSLPWEA